jgi:hypothetical protein
MVVLSGFAAAWQSVTSLYPEWLIVVLGTFLVHQVVWFVLNLPYLLLDRYHLLKQYRIAGNVWCCCCCWLSSNSAVLIASSMW